MKNMKKRHLLILCILLLLFLSVGYSFLSASLQVSGGLTLSSAKWEVTFDPSGGVVNPTSKEVWMGKPYGDLPSASLSGYYFEGWYTDIVGGDKIEKDTTYKTADNQTLFAHWSIKKMMLDFDANGGEIDASPLEVTYGLVYPVLPVPTRYGYEFNGWFTTPEGGSPISHSVLVSKITNHTAYAHWTGKRYKITFDANGGSVGTTSKDVYYGSPYGDLPTPEREGYDFAGWYTSVSGGVNKTANTTVSITDNETLYAKWVAKNYPIVYKQGIATGGTLPNNQNVPYNTVVTIGTNNMSKANKSLGTVTFNYNGNGQGNTTSTVYISYAPDGWSYSSEGGRDYPNNATFTYSITEGIELYPYFFATQHSASFPSPTRTGYSFVGWFTEASGGTQVTEYMGNANITLYAHWSPNQYTLRYNRGAATGGTLPGEQRVTFDTNVTIGTNNMSKANTNLGTVTFNYNGNGQGNTTSTAYTTYVPNGWTAGTIHYSNGQNIPYTTASDFVLTADFTATNHSAVFPNSTRTGYTFMGWYTAANGGSQIDSYTGNADITVYAHWMPNRYTLYYKKGTSTGFNIPGNRRVDYDSTITLATNNMSKEASSLSQITFNYNGNGQTDSIIYNYTFYKPNGWSNTNDGAKTYTDGQTITYTWPNDISLYPHFDTQIGCPPFPTPTRERYEFVGWYTEASGGTKITSYTGNSDITLYAHWQEVTAPALTGGTAMWIREARTVSIAAAGSAYTGVSRYEYYFYDRMKAGQSAPNYDSIATGTGTAVTLGGTGWYEVYFRTVSKGGVKSAWSFPQTVLIDTSWTIDINHETTGGGTCWNGMYDGNYTSLKIHCSRTTTFNIHTASITGIKAMRWQICVIDEGYSNSSAGNPTGIPCLAPVYAGDIKWGGEGIRELYSGPISIGDCSHVRLFFAIHSNAGAYLQGDIEQDGLSWQFLDIFTGGSCST